MTFPSLMYTFFQRVNHLNRLFVISVTSVATCIAYTYSTGNADPPYRHGIFYCGRYIYIVWFYIALTNKLNCCICLRFLLYSADSLCNSVSIVLAVIARVYLVFWQDNQPSLACRFVLLCLCFVFFLSWLMSLTSWFLK